MLEAQRMVVPVGEGVSIVAENALQETIDDENLAKTLAEHRPQNQDNWWWDE